jgi:hypothetical protein
VRRIPMIAFTTSFVIYSAAILFSLDSSDWIPFLVIGLWIGVAGGVGALVASKRSSNPIGWLFLGIQFLMSCLLFAQSYSEYGIERHPGTVPFVEAAAWLTMWLGLAGMGLFLHVFLHFPDGRLLSRRWRWVRDAATVGIVLGVAGFMVRPGPTDTIPSLDNPLGVEGLEGFSSLVEGGGSFILTCVAGLTIVALVLRYRRSSGVERQQLKSFVVAVCLFPVFFSLGTVLGFLDQSEEDYLAFALIMVGLLLIPLSMGAAILRYRLYDLDLVINRTLVYGALTAVLSGVYLGFVFGFQALLEPFTAESDLAIAGSTLAVAALFRPIRSRLQGFIDRRFYRRKVDRQKTIEEFNSQVRDEVDLNALSSRLVSVVGSTMEPAHVSLWLRTEIRA